MRKKIVYVVSDINKALAFEWVAARLDKVRFSLTFILINARNSALSEYLEREGIPVKHYACHFKRSIPLTIVKLFFYFLRERPDIVHAHLRTAELTAIPASWLARVKTRIYTRHSSTYNHLYHPKGVVLDKLMNRLATGIIAISENVKTILTELEQEPEKKVHLIHHGFDFTIWEGVNEDARKTVKEKHRIPDGKTVIGIIARYVRWKGYEYSIPALGKLMLENLDIHVVIANAKGEDEPFIRDLLRKYLPSKRYTEIIFENDLPVLYSCFDFFVHTPVDPSVEAFGQVYVEALLAKVPSVFTLSGVAPEFIQHEKNALVVDFKNSTQIYQALKRLMTQPELGQKLKDNGPESVSFFNLEHYISKLEQVYERS